MQSSFHFIVADDSYVICMIFRKARVAVEGKLPAVLETILKRRKWQAENPDLRAKKAVKSKVVFKIKKV